VYSEVPHETTGARLDTGIPRQSDSAQMRLSAYFSVLILAGALAADAQVPVTDPANPTAQPPKPKKGDGVEPAKPAPAPSTSTGDAGVTPDPNSLEERKKSDKEPPSTDTTVVVPDNAGGSGVAPPAPAYAGPGNLGRDFGFLQEQERTTRFRPYVGVSGIFASGLTGNTVNANGTVHNAHAFGAEANFGVTGTKIRAKDNLAIDYHGSIFHYDQTGAPNGTNQLLAVAYRRQVTKHISLRLDETAGVYSNSFAVASTSATTDLSVGNTVLPVSPLTQALNDRTVYLSTSADVVFRRSARLSFDLGGSGFRVTRALTSLYGVIGSSGRADTEYRITRQSTVGVYYNYTHYGYNHTFGGSDINTAGLSYSYALDKRTELRFRFGGSHVQTAGLLSFNLDPLVAALLGQSVGEVAVNHSNYIPDASAQATRRYRNGAVGVDVVVGVSPGNGLYLTSKRLAYGGHYDFSGLRRYALSIGATREQLGSLGLALRGYDAYGFNMNASRELQHNLSSSFRVEYRRYNSGGSGTPYESPYRVSMGIAWSPGDRPLPIW
jgi:hypothetical protein